MAKQALCWTVLGVVGLGVMALGGCQSIDEATGAAKIVPDEFAVVTKAPLIVPPDFNLRPPRPGSAEAAANPADDARPAQFQTPRQAADALGPGYSEGEKTLLARTGASVVDPTVRRTLSNETGYETSPDVSRQLVGGQTAAPAAAPPLRSSVDAPANANAPATTPPAKIGTPASN